MPPKKKKTPFQRALKATVKRVADEESAKSLIMDRFKVLHAYAFLLPIPTLRDSVPLSVKVFDKAIQDLERERRVFLKIANDPMNVEKPDRGIWVEGRGLVYYVLLGDK